eukprot:Blabericola_migrator_1__9426@NODE_50_length_16319_cov_92_020182_g46_i0_p3_GENE_NODE_50_length_16319_cov_92_020182_g46_i0NODE_50_length_16319_cov_92_020182_g46_i0_p3_ORF_typecomplete_len1065_score140_87AAA_12/PF13087_6/2_7e52AAA_11/PF13086_6/1_2e30AAA_19/PF13245_6/2_3e08AAA_19/PF13245_6/3_4e03Viral_helicase1/PF01443_18/4_5e03Viral_helicase1/PF01443_18/8_8e09AAA_30/PF13604_6/0_041AAA_30/PF13604_6/0_14UvrDhelicase/PF00580_21/0_00031UvrDhelicase/PF00580_21/1_6e02DUF2075/PF09848_9/0_00037DUF2075/PF09
MWPSFKAVSRVSSPTDHSNVVCVSAPGTGKSFVGLKIVETLLYNSALRYDRPILVTCFNNHALDQFLELIMERLDLRDGGIIRCGNRSESDALRNCNLVIQQDRLLEGGANRWMELLSTEAQDLTREARQILAQLRNSKIQSFRHEHFKAQKEVMKALKCVHELAPSTLQRVMRPEYYRWFEERQIDPKQWAEEDPDYDDCDKRSTASSESSFPGKNMTPTSDAVDLSQWPRAKRQAQLHSWRMDLITLLLEELPSLLEAVEDTWIKMHVIKAMQQLAASCNAKIIGMTTTGAAVRRKLVQLLGCQVVLVEEAAEAFETHIVASLSESCEHVILIGDHVQLRPKPGSETSGRARNLNVSLFERLVRNGFTSVRLNVQHRMRPEIRELINIFYDDLEDHESTKSWPNIRGVANNLFWVDHLNKERQVDGSYFNIFEAEYSAAFVKLLLKHEYKETDIAVLTFYRQQKAILLDTFSKMRLNAGPKCIRVDTVDAFQGDERDIIILNLVRSNDEKSIGFVSESNRICVSLSRARKGFYLIGNMSTFYGSNTEWAQIIQKLHANENVGTGLKLICHNHPEFSFIAKVPQDFDKVEEGGCTRKCTHSLKCGHRCPLMCHSRDPYHLKIECTAQCPSMLPCGHRCGGRCHFGIPHPLCLHWKQVTLPECGHHVIQECYKKVTNIRCTFKERGVLPCGHEVDVICYLKHKRPELAICDTPCEVILDCGCKCTGTCTGCRRGTLHKRCQAPCTKTLICGHECKRACPQVCGTCVEPCIIRCAHRTCPAACYETCSVCLHLCDVECPHRRCTLKCQDVCEVDPCMERCKRIYPACQDRCPCFCGDDCHPQCPHCEGLIDPRADYSKFENAQVYLPNCKHFVPAQRMDSMLQAYYRKLLSDAPFDGFPRCPVCEMHLVGTKRYSKILKLAIVKFNAVKAEMQKNLAAPTQARILERLCGLTVLLTRLYPARQILLSKRLGPENRIAFDFLLAKLETLQNSVVSSSVSREFSNRLIDLFAQRDPLTAQQRREINNVVNQLVANDAKERGDEALPPGFETHSVWTRIPDAVRLPPQ